MAIKLTKEEVENIKKYRYTTSAATFMDGIFDPWWNWCVKVLPESVSPNSITCAGIVVPIISFVWMC